MAISHSDQKTVYVFGFGVYEGNHVPNDVEGTPVAALLRAFGNPRIKLDSGKVVFGRECWWGPEAGFHERGLLGRELVTVDIDEARAKAGGR